MKILITGADGMLGRTLLRRLGSHELLPTDIAEMDITREDRIDVVFADFQPQTVIHCAAMTDVDGCEGNRDEAFRLNAVGAANVAAACRKHGARMIHISTDYVFDGALTRPYTEFDSTEPRTVYGASKLAGEQLVRSLCPDHLIVRIAWLYGAGGPSFIHTMLRLLREEGPPLKVVDDQIGNPTSTDVVADGVEQYLERPIAGTVHNTCAGEASWYALARAVAERIGAGREIQPCSSNEFPRPAPRPANSRLAPFVRTLRGFPPLMHWREALERFFTEHPDG